MVLLLWCWVKFRETLDAVRFDVAADLTSNWSRCGKSPDLRCIQATARIRKSPTRLTQGHTLSHTHTHTLTKCVRNRLLFICQLVIKPAVFSCGVLRLTAPSDPRRGSSFGSSSSLLKMNPQYDRWNTFNIQLNVRPQGSR